MKLTDVIIDNHTVGNTLILVNVSPYYEYIDGRRTHNITGYRYTVALPDRNFDKLAVKIVGEKLVNIPDGYNVEVKFDNLELYIYWLRGTYELGARATSIHIVEDN